jgi:hypothetical protein
MNHPEHTEIRIRALACALLQLMLLAIWPVVALTARAAKAHRGFRAELVSAVIEREVAGTAHRSSSSGTSARRQSSARPTARWRS